MSDASGSERLAGQAGGDGEAGGDGGAGGDGAGGDGGRGEETGRGGTGKERWGGEETGRGGNDRSLMRPASEREEREKETKSQIQMGKNQRHIAAKKEKRVG